jgi:hypothetical protein
MLNEIAIRAWAGHLAVTAASPIGAPIIKRCLDDAFMAPPDTADHLIIFHFEPEVWGFRWTSGRDGLTELVNELFAEDVRVIVPVDVAHAVEWARVQAA